MLTMNHEESQIILYCKGWFKGRSDPYTDFRYLTAQWAGINGLSTKNDCVIILMSIAEDLQINSRDWRQILLEVVSGNRFYNTNDPFERFINAFRDYVAGIPVMESGYEVIKMEPLDTTIFDGIDRP